MIYAFAVVRNQTQPGLTTAVDVHGKGSPKSEMTGPVGVLFENSNEE